MNVAGRFPATTLSCTPGRDYAGVVVAGSAEWLDVEVWGTGGVGFAVAEGYAELIHVAVTSLRSKQLPCLGAFPALYADRFAITGIDIVLGAVLLGRLLHQTSPLNLADAGQMLTVTVTVTVTGPVGPAWLFHALGCERVIGVDHTPVAPGGMVVGEQNGIQLRHSLRHRVPGGNKRPPL